MPRYIALIDFTSQGLKTIQDSPRRSEEFIQQARAAGVEVKDLYWTSGSHDGLLVVEAPDDQSAASLFLTLAAKGNVRTQTLRAFDRSEFEACLPKK